MQRNNWKTWLVSFALFCAMPVLGQAPVLGEILKIEVRLSGAPTIMDEKKSFTNFVRSHIRLKVGDTYRSGLENEDVKALVATGRISNVLVQSRPISGGVELVYTVNRARTTGNVILKGFDGQREMPSKSLKLKERKLFSQMTLRQDEPYSDRKVAADVRALEDYYNSKGYYDVQVVAKPKLELDKKKSVTFVITEGEKVKVEEIRFRRAHAINIIDLNTDILTTELDHNLVMI